MSLLVRKSTANVAKQPPQVVQSSDCFFTIAPQVHPSHVPTADLLKAQSSVISSMSDSCELFAANPGVKSSQKGGVECYHTSQLFGDSISTEELAHNLKEYNLCLALSCSLPSKNTTVLGMVSHADLEPGNFNSNGFCGFQIQTGKRGSMNVNVEKVGKLHYIRSIDYMIK